MLMSCFAHILKIVEFLQQCRFSWEVEAFEFYNILLKIRLRLHATHSLSRSPLLLVEEFWKFVRSHGDQDVLLYSICTVFSRCTVFQAYFTRKISLLQQWNEACTLDCKILQTMGRSQGFLSECLTFLLDVNVLACSKWGQLQSKICATRIGNMNALIIKWWSLLPKGRCHVVQRSFEPCCLPRGSVDKESFEKVWRGLIEPGDFSFVETFARYFLRLHSTSQ